MKTEEVRQYIVDSEMNLDELIFDRLDMNREDLMYDLIHRLQERIEYFQDLERHEL